MPSARFRLKPGIIDFLRPISYLFPKKACRKVLHCAQLENTVRLDNNKNRRDVAEMENEREELKAKIAIMTDEQLQWFIDQALRLLSEEAC